MWLKECIEDERVFIRVVDAVMRKLEVDGREVKYLSSKAARLFMQLRGVFS